jgi:hypothetical protein
VPELGNPRPLPGAKSSLGGFGFRPAVALQHDRPVAPPRQEDGGSEPADPAADDRGRPTRAPACRFATHPGEATEVGSFWQLARCAELSGAASATRFAFPTRSGVRGIAGRVRPGTWEWEWQSAAEGIAADCPPYERHRPPALPPVARMILSGVFCKPGAASTNGRPPRFFRADFGSRRGNGDAPTGSAVELGRSRPRAGSPSRLPEETTGLSRAFADASGA